MLNCIKLLLKNVELLLKYVDLLLKNVGVLLKHVDLLLKYVEFLLKCVEPSGVEAVSSAKRSTESAALCRVGRTTALGPRSRDSC